MASFYVQNFGCRATQADGAAIERQFTGLGLARAPEAEKAELVVLNTCTVTAAADQDARRAIRRLKRLNPQCQIIVTGCYAQRAPQELASLPGVSAVVGNSHKHQLARLLLPLRLADGRFDPAFVPVTALEAKEDRGDSRLFVSDIFAHTELVAAPVFDAGNDRTRPNLKVQDGCDNRCSFCIIPFVRGRSRSLGLDQAIGEVNQLVSAGYREVVISGINLGRWGRDLEKGQARYHLADLVRALLRETPLEKLRISSVEPMDWSDELIDLVRGSPRIAKHAHVPMQSGSDRILRAMHRKYRPWHYRAKIEKIRAAMPEAAIGADVMVGFPGESELDFELTRRMIEELPFTYLHVFTYSSRPGTPAAAMPNQVPLLIARERNQILRTLAAEKKTKFMQSFLGKRVEAITVNRFEQGATEALTDNYLQLQIQGRVEPNQWIAAEVEELVAGKLAGKLLPRNAAQGGSPPLAT